MMGPPLLLLGANQIGFTRTTSFAAAVAVVVLSRRRTRQPIGGGHRISRPGTIENFVMVMSTHMSRRMVPPIY
jgi:hypothetical protein